MEISAGELARLIRGEVDGDNNVRISRLADISFAKEGDLVFAENDKWLDKAELTGASAVIAPRGLPKKSKTLIRVDNAKLTFGYLMNMFSPAHKYETGIHPTAIVGKNAVIGENVSIQPYAVIEDDVKIGNGCVIGALSFIGKGAVVGENCVFNARTVVYPRTVIGNRVILHSGTVIGADGFGYVQHDGKRVKIPQIGKVIIEDDVEIGANSTVDCATLGETVVGAGTKIDNLVQIAHNDIIGKNCIFCAQSGVSGSCVIGNNVIVAGQAGLADHVRVGDNVIIGAQAGVPSNKIIRSDQMVFGSPARSERDTKRQMGAQARLPQFIEKVKEMEKEIEDLKKMIGNSNS